MSELTKKDMKLRDLLYDLECPLHSDFTEEDRHRSILITVLAAKEWDVTDKAIKIVEANKDKNLHDIDDMLYVTDRIFPPLEIVDDDELDDDEK